MEIERLSIQSQQACSPEEGKNFLSSDILDSGKGQHFTNDKEETATRSPLDTSTLEDASDARETAQSKLQKLLDIPGNNYCADCGDVNPKWASTNIGAFVCIRCAGIHRSLGTHVSKMLSTSLDLWTDEQVSKMAELGGNCAVNAVYEARIPSGESKPGPDADMAVRADWIDRKYVKREFHAACSFQESATGPVSTADDDDALQEQEQRQPLSTSTVGLVEFVGILKVEVIRGKKLAIRDVTLTSDPYVVLAVGNQSVKTRTIFKSLNPVWNETLLLSVPSKDAKLKLTVFDKDILTKDDYMGSAVIELHSLTQVTRVSTPTTGGRSEPSSCDTIPKSTEGRGSVWSEGDELPETPIPAYSPRELESSSWSSEKSSPSCPGSPIAEQATSSSKQRMWVKLENVERGQIEIAMEWLPLSQ